MATPQKSADVLSPTDPPILLAGLIAARRCGDKLLAMVLQRELETRGIAVRFMADLQPKREATHVVE